MRLKKYAGVGYPPALRHARRGGDARAWSGRVALPAKAAVERSLADSAAYGRHPALFDKQRQGYEQDFALLKTQLAAYDAFVPDGAAQGAYDFHLPPEVYARNLRQCGVDIPPAQLAKMAHEASTPSRRR